MPLWMVRGGTAIRRDVFRRVEEALGDRHGTPVRVHNNIRAYATYLAHVRRGAGDFLLVTIRTGLGFGIHVGGSVMRGGDGLAGEVAHLQVDPEGSVCRCGKRGCVETVVNEDAIARDYCAASGRGEASLSEIAALADRGDSAAVSALERAAATLSIAVSAVILVLDVSEIVVAAAFGRKGRIFAAMLGKHLKDAIFPHPGLHVRYDSLDSDGFLHGAALLVLRDCYE
jgi:predicted NBD/HSP70 family sugar kinase